MFSKFSYRIESDNSDQSACPEMCEETKRFDNTALAFKGIAYQKLISWWRQSKITKFYILKIFLNNTSIKLILVPSETCLSISSNDFVPLFTLSEFLLNLLNNKKFQTEHRKRADMHLRSQVAMTTSEGVHVV